MLPRSGGDKVYLEFTYQYPRFFASTLVAVQAILLGFTASNCIVFGEYVLFALGIQPTEFSQKILAVGLLTGITIMHGCFLKTGIRIQNFLGWIKVGLILFMGLTGLYVTIFNVQGSDVLVSAPRRVSWDGLFKDSNWGMGNTFDGRLQSLILIRRSYECGRRHERSQRSSPDFEDSSTRCVAYFVSALPPRQLRLFLCGALGRDQGKRRTYCRSLLRA